jgi:predicted dehydrogenase
VTVPLPVGVVGVGALGRHHARHLAALEEARLIGVYDVDPERAAAVAAQLGTTAYNDLDALLGQVEAVTVAVPTPAHAEVGLRALRRGVPVLMEKPLAASVDEADLLIAAARERGVQLQVGHIERYNRALRAAEPYLDSPRYIESQRLAPFQPRGTDVAVVLDLMIHDLDMVLSFNPGAVEEVRAAGVPVLSPTIDIANARIAFTGGCVANFTASRVSTTRMRKLRLFQRDSYLSVDYQARHAAILRRQIGSNQRPEIFMEPAKTTDDEPLKLELEAFLHAIESKTPPVVSGEDGAAALALAHRVLDAIGSFVQRHSEEAGSS